MAVMGKIVRFTNSAEETASIGREIARKLLPGDVVSLVGELGSGKTILAKGIAQGLGVKEPVVSPSFTLINEYRGRIPLYHFDLFRVRTLAEIQELGYEEYLYGRGVTVIEWAEKMEPLLPERRLEIRLKILDDNKREVVINDLSGREIV